MDFYDLFLFNISCILSIIAIVIVLYVRIKFIIRTITIYENIIIRICISDLIFEII